MWKFWDSHLVLLPVTNRRLIRVLSLFYTIVITIHTIPDYRETCSTISK